MDVDGGRPIFNRLGPSSSADNNNNNNHNHNHNSNKQQKVCFHWRQGKCTRFPCPFLHSEPSAANGKRPHQGFGGEDNHRGSGGLRRSYNFSNNRNNTWERGQSQQSGSSNRTYVKKVDTLCKHWVQNNCKWGDNCRYLHQWSTGCFSLLAPLEGHQQVCNFVWFVEIGRLWYWICSKGFVFLVFFSLYLFIGVFNFFESRIELINFYICWISCFLFLPILHCKIVFVVLSC